MVPKLFGPIRERYLTRPGGYTRVLRIEPVKEDQAESAILELVDSPKDMRFAMTAKTLSQLPENKRMNDITASYVKKVTQFRENGMEQLRDMVDKMRQLNTKGWDDRNLPAPKRVYLFEDSGRRIKHYPEDIGDWELPNSFEQEPGVVAPAGTPMWEVKKTLKARKEEILEKEQLEDEGRAETDAAPIAPSKSR